jgi:hypothetical protein
MAITFDIAPFLLAKFNPEFTLAAHSENTLVSEDFLPIFLDLEP